MEIVKQVKKRRPKTKNYFTAETEAAVIEYKNETNEFKKQLIYLQKLEYPLNKMAENICNRWKWPYVHEEHEDIKAILVGDVMLNLDKFAAEKGKAFSYFTKSMFNHMVLWNNKNYKKACRDYTIDTGADYEDSSSNSVLDIEDMSDSYREHRQGIQEFLTLFTEFLKYNSHSITNGKKKYYNVLHSIIHIMTIYERIEILNKKSVFLYIREMTDDTPQNVSRILNILESIYVKCLHYYNETGTLPKENYNKIILNTK